MTPRVAHSRWWLYVALGATLACRAEPGVDATPDLGGGADAVFDHDDAPDATALDDGGLDATVDLGFDATRDRVSPVDAPRDAVDAVIYEAPTFPDDAPRCSPGEVVSCACVDGRDGDQVCHTAGAFDPCDCDRFVDAGVRPSALATRPLPPRLLAPQSVSRVTSQRPTLRWVAPEGAARVRVELCAERACAAVIVSAEVSGTSWRPTTALRPGPVFWRVRALDADGGVTWSSATWEFFVGHRDAPVDTSFGAPQDVDGDGYDELVQSALPIGAPYNRAVYWGSTSEMPLATTRLTVVPQSIGPAFLVEQTMSDFNGDGLADLLFRQYADQTSSYSGPWIFTLSGGARDRLLSVPHVPSRPPRSSVGEEDLAFDGTCDFDGDGFADVAAPVLGVAASTDRRLRWVAVAHGDATGEMRRVDWVLDPALLYPWQMSCAGDVNGDGYGDLLMGLYNEFSSDRVEGRAVMYLGGPGSMEDPPRIVFVHPGDVWFFGGSSTRGVGDLNGDGFADLVVNMSREGVAVYYGRRDFDGASPDLVFLGPPHSSPHTGHFHYGSVYSIPGDFNGDGYADLLLSAPCFPLAAGEACGPGWIEVHHGGPRGVAAEPDFTASGEGVEGMGGHLFVGDFNGDGFADLAAQGLMAIGITKVFLGSDHGLSREPVVLR